MSDPYMGGVPPTYVYVLMAFQSELDFWVEAVFRSHTQAAKAARPLQDEGLETHIFQRVLR